MNSTENEELDRLFDFFRLIDREKFIGRQTYLTDGKRKENDAEHSFHLALMAAVLAEHAAEPVDVLHVMKMVLIHDAVEVDAGDTYAYDTAGNATKAAREQAAADRIFALLPEDQAAEYRALWDEFEARQTPESRFANTLDRIQPLLLNYNKGGLSWKERGIRAEQVISRNRGVTEAGSPALGALCYDIIERARQEGLLK